jgi:hypothetical protein
MKCEWIEQTLPYTGDALTNHWIYRNFGILGDAVVAFTGPCDVKVEAMVDLEDVLNNDAIYSSNMLHFVLELFGPTLREGVLVQRLLTAILQQKLNDRLGSHALERHGDDLFYDKTQKLSVSICTLSPTSILIHCGLNVSSANTPVPAVGLTSELGMSYEEIQHFAVGTMYALADEWKDIRMACCKVKAVGSVG